ncbi:hypothetical protein RB653_010541 [Dictyostelium firmibasis]|uniref:SMP-30/Gluconolactonase/LRE-like region domain-containing protein n=1 Tax=Dictyostelium firmibasis TaxID=79012 RepID=A0AAN7YL55_9MYCE
MMKSIVFTIILTTIFIGCVVSVSVKNYNEKSFISIVGKHHNDDSDSSAESTSTFQSGNILITDPTSLNPNQFYEFSTSGQSIYNYTTFLSTNESERCVPVDMGFLGSTLLLLDAHQGVYQANENGVVKGVWNNLKTNTQGKVGCGLSRLNVDQQNNKVYVASLNSNCDYSYIPAVFVYTVDGILDFIITNSEFNTTTGIAGDSDGNIWITDINVIYVYDKTGKLSKQFNPIKESDRIAYNGITISQDGQDSIYVSVPSYQGDMIIQISKSGELIRSIKLIGIFDGQVSGLPGSLALTSKHIFVEVPYASKKESPQSSSSESSDSSSDSSSESSGYSSGTGTSGSSTSGTSGTSGFGFSSPLSFEGFGNYNNNNNNEDEDFFSDSSASDSTTSHKSKPDIIQSYNLDDGSFDKAWGGHSCNPKNILCIPFSGFVVVP